jgi:glutaminyl-peptide cyclotransferase
VAVLLEVAELMHHRAPPVGVELVFLDGEDLGTQANPEGFCRGSRIYAERAVGADRVAAGFVFDMVGDRDLSISPEVRSVREATNLSALVLDAARATGARSFRTQPGYDVYDDHVPLLEAGIPAVDIIDFDYPAWHTTHDTPDQVSAASLAEVSAVAAWLVYDSPLARGAD